MIGRWRKISCRKIQEGWPVRAIGVATRVLAEDEITIAKSFRRRKFLGRERLFAEQSINWRGADPGQESSLRIHPAVALFERTRAQEDRSRRAQCDEFV